jgi:hypothetical protein
VIKRFIFQVDKHQRDLKIRFVGAVNLLQDLTTLKEFSIDLVPALGRRKTD